MKSKLMGILLASTFINCTMAADENFRNPIQPINLGKNAPVSLIDPNLDTKLSEIGQARYPIGGTSIKIGGDLTTAILTALSANTLNINFIKSIPQDSLSRFLICVAARYDIDSKPGSLTEFSDLMGNRRLSENVNVLYNEDTFTFHGFVGTEKIRLDSEQLLMAYLFLKEAAQQVAIQNHGEEEHQQQEAPEQTKPKLTLEQKLAAEREKNEAPFKEAAAKREAELLIKIPQIEKLIKDQPAYSDWNFNRPVIWGKLTANQLAVEEAGEKAAWAYGILGLRGAEDYNTAKKTYFRLSNHYKGGADNHDPLMVQDLNNAMDILKAYFRQDSFA